MTDVTAQPVETTTPGAIVWFTGLPSSGKSRLAQRVRARLLRECSPCCLLDGDRVRGLIQPPPGYSSSERDDFYSTLGALALELAEQGLIVLVPATAHRRLYRDRVRARAPRFIEVWMTASLDECRVRDAKRLYARFGTGDVHGLPGEDEAYEAPELAEITASGGDDDAALGKIVQTLTTPNRVPLA
ncbi:MAG TPA: adenylyl-sulfate kinase [Polyangiaceae bacterium]|nr:adenylyl-sulfate kinase [Polyangiaceae bacterium]